MKDEIDAERTFDAIAKEMNLTRIDDTTAVRLIAQKKQSNISSSTAQS